MVFSTTLFSDGFESGDFSAWTNQTGSPTVQSTTVKTGSYAMNATVAGAGWQNNNTVKTISAVNEAWIWTDIYIDSYVGNEVRGNLFLGNVLDRGCGVGLTSSRALYLYGKDKDGGVFSDTSATTLSLDTWYRLKMHIVANTVSGTVQVFLDTVNITDIATASIDYTGLTLTKFMVGHINANAPTGINIYFDNPEVSDVDEESGQNVSEVLQETVIVTDILADQKEKLIQTGETTTLQTETVTQREGQITMTENIFQTPIITALLIATIEQPTTELSAALIFGILGFLLAVCALSLIISKKEGKNT